MKKLILFLLLFFVLFVNAESGRRVAIMEIGVDNSSKQYFASVQLERATQYLYSKLAGKMNIINQTQLQEAYQDMITEGRMQSRKKCVDDQCRIELGRNAAANYNMNSRITVFNRKCTLTVELINLKTTLSEQGSGASASFKCNVDGLEKAIDTIADILSGVKVPIALKHSSNFSVSKDKKMTGKNFLVKFESNPVGALVIDEGKIVCQKTPCRRMLQEGEHRIQMMYENYETKDVSVRISKNISIAYKLKANFGKIDIVSVPTGMMVYIDGLKKGVTPQSFQLFPGNYKIKVDDMCFQAQEQYIVVKEDEDRIYEINPLPRYAILDVHILGQDGFPAKGVLSIDGVLLGSVPERYKVFICSSKATIVTETLKWVVDLHLKESKVQNINLQTMPVVGQYGIYNSNGDKLVRDLKKSYLWQGSISENQMSWSSAKDYCDALNYGGFNDWRLPTIFELETLIYDCAYESCDPFKGGADGGLYWQKGVWEKTTDKYGVFWSSSISSRKQKTVFGVFFFNGKRSKNDQGYTSYVRCIRK